MSNLFVSLRPRFVDQTIELAFKSIRYLISIIVFLGGASLTGCGKDNPSFSVLPSSKTFKQASSTINNKVDVLWVIDNSGSMSPIQNTLTAAFQSFIQGFQTKNYNFHMAITATDAYLAGSSYLNNSSYARFRDGNASHSGVFVMTNTTPNLNNVFVNNATLGVGGNGDERVVQSYMEALTNPINNQYNFRRADAFLAVIIVSDEDDFSNPNRPQFGGIDHDYNDPGNYSIPSMVTWLDTYTGSTAYVKHYNVSNISVLDIATCHPSAGSIQGIRYAQLAAATRGASGSVCNTTYDSILQSISQQIAELSTQFYLDRLPVVSSIVVYVNGVTQAQSAINGWTYDPQSNSIVFHGAAVPPQSATIQVDFQPLTGL